MAGNTSLVCKNKQWSVRFKTVFTGFSSNEIQVELKFGSIPSSTEAAASHITFMAEFVHEEIMNFLMTWRRLGRTPGLRDIEDLVMILADSIRMDFHEPQIGPWEMSAIEMNERPVYETICKLSAISPLITLLDNSFTTVVN